MSDLEQIAVDLVERARRAGASAADVVVREADEFSANLRTGKIESLKEAASKALGLRVLLGIRSATSFSSDFSEQSLVRLVDRTVAMAKVTSKDPASGLPEPGQLGRYGAPRRRGGVGSRPEDSKL
jgi:PmbA protein